MVNEAAPLELMLPDSPSSAVDVVAGVDDDTSPVVPEVVLVVVVEVDGGVQVPQESGQCFNTMSSTTCS